MTEASDRIQEEAARWLIQLESKGKPEHWAQLDAWLASNTLHRAAFLRLSVSWRKADRLRSVRTAGDEVDEDLLSPRALRARRAEKSERPRWGFAFRAAVAASVALIAAGIAAYFVTAHVPAQVYATPIGVHQRIALADGSTVVLNTDSKLMVRLTAGRRELTLLQGEAAFRVARDPRRPFDVRASDNTIRAIGTAFSVRLRNSKSAEIRVTEGRVAVNPPFTQMLAAGDTAKITGSHSDVKKIPVAELIRKLAWTEGRLYFSNENLADAVAEFNRYNRRRFVIVDARIAGLKIDGTFVADAPDEFIDAVGQAYRVRALPASGAAGSSVIRLVGKGP